MRDRTRAGWSGVLRGGPGVLQGVLRKYYTGLKEYCRGYYGVLLGNYGDTNRYYRGTTGVTMGVLKGILGYSRGTRWGTRRVPTGYIRGNRVLSGYTATWNIYRSAFDARAAPRACLRSVRSAGCRARSAAGASWTSRTTSAQWARRAIHTSVIDAAGAIYVIGGESVIGSTGYYYRDVWASTDGGA